MWKRKLLNMLKSKEHWAERNKLIKKTQNIILNIQKVHAINSKIVIEGFSSLLIIYYLIEGFSSLFIIYYLFIFFF